VRAVEVGTQLFIHGIEPARPIRRGAYAFDEAVGCGAEKRFEVDDPRRQRGCGQAKEMAGSKRRQFDAECGTVASVGDRCRPQM
jgi:hypothetical protein